MNLILCILLCCVISIASTFRINLTGLKEYELPRFWTSTGFCPGAIQDTATVLSSDDVLQNLIHISALPRNGLQYVRIHWIFDLIHQRWVGRRKTPEINRLKFNYLSSSPANQPLSYNYTQLDTLYDKQKELNIYPHVEFMRSSGFKRKIPINWRDLVMQFLQHYIHRYSLKEVNRWRFETWNEPDLPTYNRMNWRKPSEYFQYIYAVQSAFAEIRRRYPNFQGELRGPAGTFKSPGNHKFCYGVLEQCQLNTTSCPFDILTFHRKGTTGRAKQILKGEMELLKELETSYPFLKTRMWSNSEADVSTGWSIPLESNTGIDYAREVVSNIFYHWTALNRGHSGRRLESISQDNAFLSYHPFEFNQRTLLARFQMNETKPQPYSEFIQKPVYAAMGFLSNLGSRADVVRRKNGLTIMKSSSRSESYYSILIVGAKSVKQKLNVNFTGFDTKKSFGVLVEVLQNDQKDPYAVWQKHGAPPYPPSELFVRMRKAQAPTIFYSGLMGSYLKIQGSFKPPFILQVRLCDKRTLDKWSFGNVTLHLVTPQTVLVHWHVNQKSFNCLKGFQVFFRADKKKRWVDVSQGYHTPWHSFYYAAEGNGTVFGEYKVKANEIFSGKQSRFSSVVRLKAPGE